ncbi:MAG: HAD-IA family hydrolase [Candidatus Latescibacterota bacterium]|nr:MAG: HAD-IA family hydrolase [Candidatus Latescibacterota bacterium]
MGPVRHVFLDWTNTLVRVRGSVGQIYADLARRFGLRADAQEIDDGFAAIVKAVPQRVAPGLPDAEIDVREREWWRAVASRALAPYGDFERFDEFFDEVYELFRRPEAWELLPHARQAVDALHAQGRRLGIVSDMDSRLFDLLRALELDDCFEVVSLSFRVGFQKPDPRLFADALERAGADAAQSAHVGDSLTSDVSGALEAGLAAIHFDESRAGGAPPGVHVIHSLAQLPTLLTALDARASP